MDQHAKQRPVQRRRSGFQPGNRIGFRPGQSGNPLGRASPRIRAEAAEAERQLEVAALLKDLGHSPTTVERILIDELAALVVRARHLRTKGKPSEDCARLIARITRRLGIEPGKLPERKSQTLTQYWASRSAEGSES